MLDIPIITIDGPSGSGKGTISRLLAQKLAWNLLDSGALYRVLALAAQRHSVAFDNEPALEALAANLDVVFSVDPQSYHTQIMLEGEDVTAAIRSEDCGKAASKVSALVGVRRALVDRQRAFCQHPGLVTDGRDMGTVIFPEAGLKIFLVASQEERANRRQLQLQEKGVNVNIVDILSDLMERDSRDSGRAASPLKAAEDAVQIDTTELSIDEVLAIILKQAEGRFKTICH